MIYIFIFTDEEIIKLKLRDPAVFEKIYKKYKLDIYNFLLIKTNGNVHTAEEILSDTICSAFISAPKLRDKNKILKWLLQIANRRFIDFLRKKYRDEKIQKEIEKKTSPEDNAYEQFEEDDEKVLMLNWAIGNLKPKYQKVIKLKYIQNKSLKEIAEEMNQTFHVTTSLLSRAKKALKKEIKKIDKEKLNES